MIKSPLREEGQEYPNVLHTKKSRALQFLYFEHPFRGKAINIKKGHGDIGEILEFCGIMMSSFLVASSPPSSWRGGGLTRPPPTPQNTDPTVVLDGSS